MAKAKRVLLGWELGAGSGHIQRFVPIVDAYLRDGWDVIAATRDVRRSQGLFAAFVKHPRFKLVQAPIFSHRKAPATRVSSFPEIFVQMGFARTELVEPVVTAWRKLVFSSQPDIIISDTAPSLNLAVRGHLPVIVIGNGWTVPPPGSLVPSGTSPELLVQAKLAVQQVVEAAEQTIGGAWYPIHFSDLLRGDANFVCTPAQLDPYAKERQEPLYWPAEIPAPKAHPGDAPLDGLIYLPARHPALPAVYAAAEQGSLAIEAYLGGSGKSSGRLRISPTPIDFATKLPGSRMVVHHGGLGTASWCLLNRVPQVICPTDLEKALIAKAILDLGAGILISPKVDPGRLIPTFEFAVTMSLPQPDLTSLATLSGQATVSEILRRSHHLIDATTDDEKSPESIQGHAQARRLQCHAS